MHAAGIIGYGGMGRNHATVINKPDNFQYTTIYDIDPERRRIAAADGKTVAETLERLLHNPALDTILVATPNHLHCELAAAALAAGKNVICEKPAALSPDEWNHMLTMAKKYNRRLMVHHNRRWDRDFRIVESVLNAGTLGEVFRIESRVQGSRGIAPTWRREAAFGGGLMYDWGVHLIDQILQLIRDKIEMIHCEFQFITQREVDENFRLTLYFQNGSSALIEIGTANFQMLPRWYVCGRRGTTLIPYWDCTGESVCAKQLEIDWEEEIAPNTVIGPSRTFQPRADSTVEHLPLPEPAAREITFYENWVGLLEGKAEPIVSNNQVTRVLRLMEAAFQSAAERRSIQFSDN